MVAISQAVYGVDPKKVSQAVNYYLTQGFTPLGASYLVGNMLQESRLDPGSSYDDQYTGNRDSLSEGLLQWTFDRKKGMPNDFEGQLRFALTEMDRDAGGNGLKALLKNPNATREQLKAGLKAWVRWGVEGGRFTYGDQIYAQITGQPLPPVSPDSGGGAGSIPGDYSTSAAGLGGTLSAVKSGLFNGENCPPPLFTQQDRIIYTGCQSIISSFQAGGSGSGFAAPGVGSIGNAQMGLGATPYSGTLNPGGLITPIEKGKYTVTSDFGPRSSPCAGCSSFHKGIDLAADTGTTIVAATDGKVILASFQGGAGCMTTIQHNSGMETDYFHQSSILVKVGDIVKQGQVIGKVGMTSSLKITGPHLHFQTRPGGGQAVDPKKYIKF